MIHNIVVCPITREKLQLAPPEVMDDLNLKIQQKSARNKRGEQLTSKINKALVNQSRTLLYPIVSDIPLLVPDSAIELMKING